VRFYRIIFAICFCVAVSDCRTHAQPALPSLGGSFSTHHTTAKLILSTDTAKPGDTIWAGVDLKMEPGWHTYWKNSGAAGLPTKIQWQLPAGITAGEIQWPLPEKLPPAEVTTYGYEDETMLIVPLTVETNSNLPMGQVDVKANVSWLECKDVCIPANQVVEAKLNIGTETKTSADAAFIKTWQKTVPQAPYQAGDNGIVAVAGIFPFHFYWGKTTNDDTRSLLVQLIEDSVWEDNEWKHATKTDFYPYSNENFEVEADSEIVTNLLGTCLQKPVKKYSGDWPKEISGVMVLEGNHSRIGFDLKFPVYEFPTKESLAAQDAAVRQREASESSVAEKRSETGKMPAPLWQMFLYAFIGGLILNIMPCVLPVIALKILGFVSEARSEPRHVRNLGFIYALGVLVSFLALAAIVIAVKAAGHHAGWGMQFGNPIFLVCLTTLVTLVALNLFGVFEVTIGGKTLNAAGQLASKHGAPGAFFNGLLATTLATPCTAPFLAPALGFAFAQNAETIVLIFLFVGLGLAAPYVLLSCNPALLKFLPKPGAWMEKFKIAMGFPMLATTVWLFNIAGSSYGKDVFWLGVFLVIVAFAAWIFGTFVQRGNHKTLAAIITVLLLAGGYAFALEKELNWRAPISANTPTASGTTSADEIPWQPWSPEAVAAARAAGRPVIVDFTADWCLTCQVNKKLAIEITSVRAKLKEINAVALVADYTRTPENISAELDKFNRAGVPLVLVYPKEPDAPAIVLPEVLTPGIVLNALDKAAK